MDRRDLEREIRGILERAAAAENDEGCYLARQEQEFEKWRLIHKYVHQNPFTDAREVAAVGTMAGGRQAGPRFGRD